MLDSSLLWDIVIGGREKEVDRALLMTEKEFYLVVVLHVVLSQQICPASSSKICPDAYIGDYNHVTLVGLSVRYQHAIKHGIVIDASIDMLHKVTTSSTRNCLCIIIRNSNIYIYGSLMLILLTCIHRTYLNFK